MSFIFSTLFFTSFFSLFKFFQKKILVLLFLELSFLSLVLLNLIFSFSGKALNSFFSSLILLTFMVLDSVFGLCLLIFSSRNSSNFSFFSSIG